MFYLLIALYTVDCVTGNQLIIFDNNTFMSQCLVSKTADEQDEIKTLIP